MMHKMTNNLFPTSVWLVFTAREFPRWPSAVGTYRQTLECARNLENPNVTLFFCFAPVSNPECRYLASSSKDGSIRVWDAVLGRCEKILTGHTQSVTCVKWGGDGLLYTSSQDRTVKVWRAKDVSACSSPLAMSVALIRAFLLPLTRCRASCAGPCRATPTGSTLWPSAQTTSCAPALLNPRQPPSTPRMSLDRVSVNLGQKRPLRYLREKTLTRPPFCSFTVEELKEKALQRYNKVRVSAACGVHG